MKHITLFKWVNRYNINCKYTICMYVCMYIKTLGLSRKHTCVQNAYHHTHAPYTQSCISVPKFHRCPPHRHMCVHTGRQAFSTCEHMHPWMQIRSSIEFVKPGNRKSILFWCKKFSWYFYHIHFPWTFCRYLIDMDSKLFVPQTNSLFNSVCHEFFKLLHTHAWVAIGLSTDTQAKP